MTNESRTSSDEQLLLRDVRALLDQLQLDRDHSLTMQSRLSDDLGVDSLALVELCDQLERTFDVSLPDEVFLSATTPQQWLAAIISVRGGAPSARDVREDRVNTSTAGASARARRKVVARILRIGAAVIRRTIGNRIDNAATSESSTGATSSSILYAMYAWTVLVPFALIVYLLALVPLPLARRRELGRSVARLTCRALHISVQVQGELPDTGHPYVIASNHSSFIDGLVLYVFTDVPLTFVSSTDMEHQFLLGRIMRSFGCVFVDRGRAERGAASVEVLVNTIQRGEHLLIFPEGSISVRPGLRVFHLGAFETATSSNCPVVPIGLRGTREILRPGSFRPHPGHVRVGVGAAVMPTGGEFRDRVALRDEVRNSIASLTGGEETTASK